MNYIYTADIEFIYERSSRQRDPNVKVIQGTSQGKKESPLIMELRKRIDDYFAVVLRGMRDTIPKQIGNFLVKGVQDKMRTVLFEITHNSREFFGYLEEVIITTTPLSLLGVCEHTSHYPFKPLSLICA